MGEERMRAASPANSAPVSFGMLLRPVQTPSRGLTHQNYGESKLAILCGRRGVEAHFPENTRTVGGVIVAHLPVVVLIGGACPGEGLFVSLA